MGNPRTKQQTSKPTLGHVLITRTEPVITFQRSVRQDDFATHTRGKFEDHRRIFLTFTPTLNHGDTGNAAHNMQSAFKVRFTVQ